MRIGLIGQSEFLYNSAVAILDAGFQIGFIVTSHARPEHTRTEADFGHLAQQRGLPFLLTEAINADSTHAFIAQSRPDVGLSINCGRLIGSRVRACFPRGVLNVHFGDLPRYRGNAVLNWAIVAGERSAACTIHLMDDSLDSGPILLKEHIDIGDVYIGQVLRDLAERVPSLVVRALRGLEKAEITPTPQPGTSDTSLRCYPRLSTDGEVQWDRSAEEIARLVRASAEPLAGAYTHLDGRRLTIWKAHTEDPVFPFLAIPGSVLERRMASQEVVVSTGCRLLVIEEAQLDMGRRMRPAGIITSVRARLGLNSSSEIMALRERVTQLESTVRRLLASCETPHNSPGLPL